MLSNIASQIKSAVTMTDVCERYGIDVNRQGFAVCPFHNEKTASLKIYQGARGFSCFGCGRSGDVISFTQTLFGLSFSDALKKLNSDFGLCLPLERKMSLREKYAFSDVEKKRNQEKAEREQLIKNYESAFDRYAELDKLKIKHRPKTPDEDLHPDFIKALHGLSSAEYDLNLAEGELFAYEMRKLRRQNDCQRHCG